MLWRSGGRQTVEDEVTKSKWPRTDRSFWGAGGGENIVRAACKRSTQGTRTRAPQIAFGIIVVCGWNENRPTFASTSPTKSTLTLRKLRFHASSVSDTSAPPHGLGLDYVGLTAAWAGSELRRPLPPPPPASSGATRPPTPMTPPPMTPPLPVRS